MMEPNPRFTGIFIPVEILELEELSPLEQMLISWIDALYCKDHRGCYASNEYLAERLKVKENTIVKSLTKLRKIGLIEDVAFNGRTRVIKAKIAEYVEKSQSYADCDLNPMQGRKKIPCRVGKKSFPSIYNSKEESKEEMSQAAIAARRLAFFLREQIMEVNPKAKEQNVHQWEKDIEKLIRIDGRNDQEIHKVIIWVSKNDFWRKIILSGRKLREKFDQLFICMVTEKKSPKKQEKEKLEEKSRLVKRNSEWSKEYFKNGDIHIGENSLVLRENGVHIKLNGAHHIIGFLEHGFADQVRGVYEKIKE